MKRGHPGIGLGSERGPFRQRPIIAELLPLRHELAQLLGFRVTPSMPWPLAWRRTQAGHSFLDDLARRCLPAGRQEFSDLEEFAA